MRISFVTLGCKVNLCETQGLMQIAQERGYEIVQRDAQAVVINSCAVTAVSEHKNIRALHKARKENPDAVIAVIGCMAQTNGERLLQDGTADLIFGVQDRAAILDRCEEAIKRCPHHEHTRGHIPIGTAFEELPAGIPQGRTRALLKVEDGCNNFCSYCIIPYARGRVRSLAPEKALHEAARLTREGVHEIVVTGIEISSYGQDLNASFGLIELMERLCSAFPTVRFRLGSLEPRTITDLFCERLSGFSNLAPHFHLSLQSGSDTVLRRMNRKYDTALFRSAVQCLRRAFPCCSITADVIVGFPGETEQEFAETCAFVRELGFSDVHVFPYSIRPGTKAAQMANQLDETLKKQRADILRDLVERESRLYRESFIGQVLEVLPEHRDRDGVWTGHSAYAFPIYIAHRDLKKNEPVRARLCAVERDGLSAELFFEG